MKRKTRLVRGSKTSDLKRSKHNKSSVQGQGEESFPNIEVMGAGVRAELSAKAALINVKTLVIISAPAEFLLLL